MIEFGFPIDVDRPPHEVFAYLTDPGNLREWQGTHEAEQLTDGPVGPGTRFREVHLLMGRRLESITEVSAYEPDRRFAVRIVSGPTPIDGRWELEPRAGGGTRLHFSASGAPRPRLLAPLMKVALRRQFRRQHERLKRAVEERAATGG
jgi:uncharacterized protein YndB with AHSA1/START domain